MTWNYRVVLHEGVYAIHETFYDDNADVPHSITVTPVYPIGESLEELKGEMDYFMNAFKRPVLNYDDIGVESEDDRDLAEGHYQTFDTIEDFMADLDNE